MAVTTVFIIVIVCLTSEIFTENHRHYIPDSREHLQTTIHNIREKCGHIIESMIIINVILFSFSH